MLIFMDGKPPIQKIQISLIENIKTFKNFKIITLIFTLDNLNSNNLGLITTALEL